MAGLELPATGATDWKFPDGDLRYIELEITEVAFEQASAFPSATLSGSLQLDPEEESTCAT